MSLTIIMTNNKIKNPNLYQQRGGLLICKSVISNDEDNSNISYFIRSQDKSRIPRRTTSRFGVLTSIKSSKIPFIDKEIIDKVRLNKQELILRLIESEYIFKLIDTQFNGNY